MINEREEFLSYINFPEYTSHSKTDYGYLGRFTLKMFEDLTGFNRVLTILARGYMFDEEGMRILHVQKGQSVLGAVFRIRKKPNL